jgi:decaprenylphospho-beta-D-erythro-pentofuranosid-2-ulose 2-reductase
LEACNAMKRVLIIGATSAIASACARLWARQGANLFLVARDLGKMEALGADLRVRGAAAVHTWQMDATNLAAHPAMLKASVDALGSIDVALIAHGTLPDQTTCESDAALALSEFATNGTSVIALLTILANQFAQQRCGSIGVITSVAGDRGRPGNYVYGSAKAVVSVFCEGLRARLFKSGVSLTDIRPGFVATPMTCKLSLPAMLVVQPDVIARRIVAGIERKIDVLYAPAFWALIMAIIRNIPRPVFKRMTL